MKVVPEQVHATWIDALTDSDLVDIEARLHRQFAVIERREKRARGQRYDFFRGPAELMRAWDRWSRVNTATRARRLHPRRETR